MDEGKYWEGLASILDKDDRIDFVSRPTGSWPLEEKPETLQGLKAFSHNYLKYREENDALIVTDLRLGMQIAYRSSLFLRRKTIKVNGNCSTLPGVIQVSEA